MDIGFPIIGDWHPFLKRWCLSIVRKKNLQRDTNIHTSTHFGSFSARPPPPSVICYRPLPVHSFSDPYHPLENLQLPHFIRLLP